MDSEIKHSAEYKALVQLTSALQLALKTQITQVGGELVSAGLITAEEYKNLKNPVQPEDMRTADLVQAIQDRVLQNQQCYQTFVNVLEKDESRYGDILKRLHEKLRQQWPRGIILRNSRWHD